MAKKIGIGRQNFAEVITRKLFYIDKTMFIKEWWENEDEVTLITRPRRFGKTLNLSMVEQFFSAEYADRGDLFQGLSIWEEEKFRALQGTYPVLSISFAEVKETNFGDARKKVCHIITNLYNKYDFLLDSGLLNGNEQAFYRSVSAEMENYIFSGSLKALSEFLFRYYGKKVIILLDEYDTPMQEAYVKGYWQEMVDFMRGMLNAAFKSNPYLDRAVMTGITRVSKESIFSDLNNLKVVTATSGEYEDSFGFTEEEVFSALEEYGMEDRKADVKSWYDGFIFGKRKDIYNPWSILNFIRTGEFGIYWANTSSNKLIGKLVQEGTSDVKMQMEDLLQGKVLHTVIDEQIVFSQLEYKESAIWSLFLASGYLKAEHCAINEKRGRKEYDLRLTNKEVRLMFEQLIEEWFAEYTPCYNAFIKAMLRDDIKAMNAYMNKVALETFSFFDTGRKLSETTEPERFYHGFVLELMVDLADEYTITSNRESGFGRYDVVLEPQERGRNTISNSSNGEVMPDHCNRDAIIIEFKVHDPENEKDLKESVQAALRQIEEKQYAAALEAKGIPGDKIRKYGFAFEGKKVLIG